jgi:hypothetical protein
MRNFHEAIGDRPVEQLLDQRPNLLQRLRAVSPALLAMYYNERRR